MRQGLDGKHPQEKRTAGACHLLSERNGRRLRGLGGARSCLQGWAEGGQVARGSRGRRPALYKGAAHIRGFTNVSWCWRADTKGVQLQAGQGRRWGKEGTLTFSPFVPFRPRMPSAPYTNRGKMRIHKPEPLQDMSLSPKYRGQLSSATSTTVSIPCDLPVTHSASTSPGPRRLSPWSAVKQPPPLTPPVGQTLTTTCQRLSQASCPWDTGPRERPGLLILF